MKQRFSSHTTLIELTAALLFFMLASVTILGLFTTAYGQSRQAQLNTRALQLARDCANMIAASEDAHEALTVLGYEKQGNGVYVHTNDADLTVIAALDGEQTEVGALLTGVVSVLHADDTLIELPVSRYENKEVIHP